MDELASQIDLRRRQLVELRAMLADGHTGAAEAIERVRAYLRQLGADEDHEPSPAAPAEHADLAPAVDRADAAPAVKPATRKPAGTAKRRR